MSVADIIQKDHRGTTTPVSKKTRRDFAEEIYKLCVDKNSPKPNAISSTNATWFSLLKEAIRHTDESLVAAEQWIDGLAAAMTANDIDWMPGSHRGRFTCWRVIQLAGPVVPKPILAARPGSMKRAAMEAAYTMETANLRPKKTRRRVIDFGCAVPFQKMPKTVREGFEKLDRIFEQGDQGVLDHYHVARNCLEKCLGDPLYDVMMMLVLTLASSTITPHIAPGQRMFSAALKNKDPSLLAANMVTRMLWFMRPGAFPWDKNDKGVLRVSEMTKKIGK